MLQLNCYRLLIEKLLMQRRRLDDNGPAKKKKQDENSALEEFELLIRGQSMGLFSSRIE